MNIASHLITWFLFFSWFCLISLFKIDFLTLSLIYAITMASPFDDDVDPEIVEEALQDALENPEENFDAFKTLLTALWEMIKIDTEHFLIAC